MILPIAGVQTLLLCLELDSVVLICLLLLLTEQQKHGSLQLVNLIDSNLGFWRLRLAYFLAISGPGIRRFAASWRVAVMVDESDAVDNISHKLGTVARFALVGGPLIRLLVLAVLRGSLHGHHAVEVSGPGRVQIFILEHRLAVNGASFLVVVIVALVHHAELGLVAPLVRLLVRLQLVGKVNHALSDANAQPRPQH